MEELLNKLRDFSLTMDENLCLELFGEDLGKHLWSSYPALNYNWLMWYGYLDSDNRKIISDYLEKKNAPTDFYALNKEFVSLLYKHEDDEEFVNPESQKEMEEGFGDADGDLFEYYAQIYNAFDELCDLHKDIADKIKWMCGDDHKWHWENPWDLTIVPVDYN